MLLLATSAFCRLMPQSCSHAIWHLNHRLSRLLLADADAVLSRCLYARDAPAGRCCNDCQRREQDSKAGICGTPSSSRCPPTATRQTVAFCMGLLARRWASCGWLAYEVRWTVCTCTYWLPQCHAACSQATGPEHRNSACWAVHTGQTCAKAGIERVAGHLQLATAVLVFVQKSSPLLGPEPRCDSLSASQPSTCQQRHCQRNGWSVPNYNIGWGRVVVLADTGLDLQLRLKDRPVV